MTTTTASSFRQPTNEGELAAIMSADSEEVFACYRFDGLSRWTPSALRAWVEDMDVVVGYLRDTLSADPEPEIAEGLRAYESYLSGSDFKAYLAGIRRVPSRALIHPPSAA